MKPRRPSPINLDCSCGGVMEHFLCGVDIDSYQCPTCKGIDDRLRCCGMRYRPDPAMYITPETCPGCGAKVRDVSEAHRRS